MKFHNRECERNTIQTISPKPLGTSDVIGNGALRLLYQIFGAQKAELWERLPSSGFLSSRALGSGGVWVGWGCRLAVITSFNQKKTCAPIGEGETVWEAHIGSLGCPYKGESGMPIYGVWGGYFKKSGVFARGIVACSLKNSSNNATTCAPL
ncbi:hypothetical protein Ddc_15677 [Ditylenchus destructor]|nr:hypothetical protein Ddc_15677 [Ditylenchus destructor]